MEDTTCASQQLVYDVVMSKTVEERFLICAEMYEEAKEFARIGMPEGLSMEMQEAFIFQRIHGIDPETCVRIGSGTTSPDQIHVRSELKKPTEV